MTTTTPAPPAASSGAPSGPAPAEPRGLVPVLVYLGMTVSVVSSLGAPLVPTIALADHVSLADAQWSLTIALLVGALATPVLGRLGDGPHRRAAVLGVLSVVVAGSALAALPLPFWTLLVGRAAMGTGLGLIPLTMAAARDALAGERRTRVIGLLSITAAAGIGLGYPLSGLATERLSFRAAFGFGAAVVAVGLALAWRVLPASHGPRRRLDWLGALLLGAGTGGLLLALAEAETWATTDVLLLAAGSAALLLGWVAHELRTPLPLVDLRLLRSRAVLTADATGLLAGLGMYVLMSVIVRYAQTPRSAGYGLGDSVVVSGLLLLPLSLLSTAASRVAPAIGRRFGAAAVLPVGCAVFALADVLFALERGNEVALLGVMALAGLGVGCTFAALPGLVVSGVPAEETGSAMSLNVVLRYVGYSTGSALAATLLEGHTPRGRLLPTDAGYTEVALVGIVVLVVAGVASAVLPRGGGPRARPPAGGPSSTSQRTGEDGAMDDGPVDVTGTA